MADKQCVYLESKFADGAMLIVAVSMTENLFEKSFDDKGRTMISGLE